MELLERLKDIMRREFGIETDEQLMKAVRDMKIPDLGIFTVPMDGEWSEKKTA